MREKKTLSLDPASAAVIAQLPNASYYIDSALSERWSAWQESLETLREYGWTAEQILEAASPLAMLRTSRRTRDPAVLSNILDAHIPGHRLPGWRRVVAEINHATSHALLVVTSELWAQRGGGTHRPISTRAELSPVERAIHDIGQTG